MIGIGGIGMSALATVLIDKGCCITGSDIKENELIKKLKARNAEIKIGHKASNVSSQDLVVYSSSIRAGNAEIIEAGKRKIPAIPRMGLLKGLMEEKKNSVAVTGTHGKTTITAMVSCLLEKAGYDPSVLIGGEHSLFNGNAKLGKSEYLVAEVDESDKRFVTLRSRYLIIPNLEMEHPEYYKSEKELFGAFRTFLKLQKKSSSCFYCKDEEKLNEALIAFKGRKISYGFSESSRFRAANVRISPSKSDFDCFDGRKRIGHFSLFVPGRHNIANALAAISFGTTLGIGVEAIKKAIREYRGVKRRFELVGNVNGIKIVEDYAHHPTEIKATIEAARSLRPKRLITVFQPHRYTRTHIFTEEFSRSFDGSDKLILTEIYAASEDKIKNVSAENIYRAIKKRRPSLAEYMGKKKIPNYVSGKTKKGDLVLVLGAGDINRSARSILERLKKMRQGKKIRLKGRVIFDEPLSKRTTLGIGGTCEMWAEPVGEIDLRKVVSLVNSERKKIFVMGAGSNILASDQGFKGVVINLNAKGFKKITIKKKLVKAGAGVLLGRLIGQTSKKGLGGLEGLSGIPGTLGGAIYMNASFKAGIFDFLESIMVMDIKTARIKRLKKKDISFGYRNSNLAGYIILEASFMLKAERPGELLRRGRDFLNIRKKTQPILEKSAGCVFKNPEKKRSAGFYIERAGLKGKREGALRVSEKHANYIVAAKGASSGDFIKLVNMIKKRVRKKFNIDLQQEIIIL